MFKAAEWLRPYERPLRVLLFFVGLVLFGGFLWYLSRPFMTGEYDLWMLLSRITWQTLLLMFLLYAVAAVLAVWAWGSMMGEMTSPIPWKDHWYIYTTTNVTRRLPGSFWHVASRVVLYQQHGVSKRTIAVISGLEIALIMFSGAVIVLLSWPILQYEVAEGWQRVLVIGGVLGGAFILLNPSNWQRMRAAAGEVALKEGSFRAPLILLWLFTYALCWCLGGLMVALLAASLAPLPVAAVPGIVTVWTLAGLVGFLIIVLPSGLGVTELSLTAMLSLYMPTPLAALVAIGTRLLFTLFELLFALLAWLLLPVFRRLTRK